MSVIRRKIIKIYTNSRLLIVIYKRVKVNPCNLEVAAAVNKEVVFKRLLQPNVFSLYVSLSLSFPLLFFFYFIMGLENKSCVISFSFFRLMSNCYNLYTVKSHFIFIGNSTAMEHNSLIIIIINIVVEIIKKAQWESGYFSY